MGTVSRMHDTAQKPTGPTKTMLGDSASSRKHGITECSALCWKVGGE